MRQLFHYDVARLKNNVQIFSEIFNYKYLVLVITLVSSLLIILMLSSKLSSTRNNLTLQKQHNLVVLKKLNDINENILLYKKIKNSTDDQKLILKISNEITTLEKISAGLAKDDDIKNISKLISSVKDDVDGRFDDLKNEITNSLGNKEYLDIKNLPFEVIAIDAIAGERYLSVNYNNHIFPLAIGDSLAGWRVNNADYNSGMAELVNDKKQFVKVILKGVSNESDQ